MDNPNTIAYISLGLSVLVGISQIIIGILQYVVKPKRAPTQEKDDIAGAASKIADASDTTFGSLLKRIEWLEKQVERIPKLEEENENLKKEYDKLKIEYYDLKRDYEGMKMDYETAVIEKVKLGQRISELEEKIRVMEENGNGKAK